jgi:site-specific DNA recombinase
LTQPPTASDLGRSQSVAPKRLFAFAGRVSTEDQQDPEASRNWQLGRARALIEPLGGVVVAEFFDIGLSRSLPWKRRPEAARLLEALKHRDRGFDAVVIGEPQRAFYGNQFGLTFPVFVHYGVELWVPEVGGPIDPESEAHELIMNVFGGMSKGERTRIKIRVRAAMASQAKIEGRYLGGRPPYGYQLVDVGPHPNPAKAAEGRRLRRLEPDPTTAATVRRIYAEYLAGRGIFAIAEGLTHDHIPSPSQHDRARNRHRTGQGWAKAAVRAILSNPRYTGRQVWNRQRKEEVLLDIEEVALGYETKMRWNAPTAWVWSDAPAHPPLVSVEDFTAAQTVRADHGRSRQAQRETNQNVRHPHILRGLLFCGLCGRKMQAQRSHEQTYYRCRYPREYALATHVKHPVNVYLRESDVLPALDQWLSTLFAPHRLDHTIRALAAAQPATTPGHAPVDPVSSTDHAAIIADCNTRLARYQAALDAGADPATVATWTRQVQAERAAALAAATTSPTPAKNLTETDIQRLIAALGDILDVLRDADPADKARVYTGLRLRLTYQPAKQIVRAEANLDPNDRGAMGCVRGGIGTLTGRSTAWTQDYRVRRMRKEWGASPRPGQVIQNALE